MFNCREKRMERWIKVTVLTSFLLLVPVFLTHGAQPDLNTILMRSTFKIAGKGTIGTAFVIGKPVSPDSERLYYILVTAAHVLKDIKEEQATLFLRKMKQHDEPVKIPMRQYDEFVKMPMPLTIRKEGLPLWKEHPKADIAVMYITLPYEADIQLLPMSLLVTDEELEKYEIHPGDILSCLGYPYGAEANEAGFPILRSGEIASYPLTPTKKVKTFLYDFSVFAGNSGGPVYFVDRNRSFGGQIFLSNVVAFIAGVITEEGNYEEEITSLTETRRVKHPLSLAIVVHASLIKEAIDLLPEKPD